MTFIYKCIQNILSFDINMSLVLNFLIANILFYGEKYKLIFNTTNCVNSQRIIICPRVP